MDYLNEPNDREPGIIGANYFHRSVIAGLRRQSTIRSTISLAIALVEPRCYCCYYCFRWMLLQHYLDIVSDSKRSDDARNLKLGSAF